jgi:amidophosphoribosyltransferase
MKRLEGAYSIVLSTETALYAFRDPWGIRAVVLWALEEDNLHIAARIMCAGDGRCDHMREIAPVRSGAIDRWLCAACKREVKYKPSSSMFEYIYFAS